MLQKLFVSLVVTALFGLSGCTTFRAGIRDLKNRNQVGEFAPSIAAGEFGAWVGKEPLLDGDWYLVAFIKPSWGPCSKELPPLVELAEEEDVVLVGLTDAPAAVVVRYREEQKIDFPILSSAESQREQWGVRLVWGNVVRLVDPEGRVVAEGLKAAAQRLSERSVME